MRLRFRTAATGLLSLVCFSLIAQKKGEEPPPVLAPEFKHFVELNNLSEQGMTAWHLKAAFHRYGPENKTLEDGVFEKWWYSPASWKLIVHQNGQDQVFVHDQGRTWSTASGDVPPVSVEILEPLIVEPVPEALLAGAEAEKKPRTKGPISLNCMAVKRKDMAWATHGYATSDSTVCFDVNGAMRSYAPMSMSFVRNEMKSFENRLVATQILGADASGKNFAAEVLELNGLTASDLDLRKDGLLPNIVYSQFFRDEVPPGRFPKVIHSVSPEYPPSARMQHRMGTVVLHVIMSTTGKVESVDILASPGPDLAESAQKAVQQWVYEPVNVNGEPGKAEAIIAVNYNLSG